MNIKDREKEISLKISSKLEFMIKKEKTRASTLSEFIGVTSVNFSRSRNNLKRGKLPTSYFLIGISNFFNENFFEL